MRTNLTELVEIKDELLEIGAFNMSRPVNVNPNFTLEMFGLIEEDDSEGKICLFNSKMENLGMVSDSQILIIYKELCDQVELG